MGNLNFMSSTLSHLFEALARFGFGSEHDFTCDIAQPFEGFDVNRYMGRWYSIENPPMNWFSNYLRCTTADYGPYYEEEGKFTGTNSSQFWYFPMTSQTGDVFVDESYPDGQAYVAIYSDYEEGMEPNYHVIDTDYETYSFVYSCNPEDHEAFFWILGRTPELAEGEYERLMEKAKGMLPNYDWNSSLTDTHDDWCWYN